MAVVLDSEQQAVVDLVSCGHSCFFSGPAGTGKSIIFKRLSTAQSNLLHL